MDRPSLLTTELLKQRINTTIQSQPPANLSHLDDQATRHASEALNYERHQPRYRNLVSIGSALDKDDVFTTNSLKNISTKTDATLEVIIMGIIMR